MEIQRRTQRRWPCEGTGRGWSYAVLAKKHTRFQKMKAKRKDLAFGGSVALLAP